MNNIKNISPKITLVILLIIYFSILLLFIYSLPSKLFKENYSVVLLDKNGELLGASIADDGQWRFPETDSLCDKYVLCLTEFEDKRFFFHPGIDPIAIIRAMYLNIKHGSTISGGSTISMQTIRLARKNKNRTYFEKLIEMILAIRLEIRYSKDEILNIYASHAPFGGNVVGIEAASWRYFGRSPTNLSLAENAMLAVLPNSPSLIHIGRNREKLEKKRNSLLHRLHEKGYIDESEYLISVQESIPDRPHPYPLHAYHLLVRAKKDYPKQSKNGKIQTSIDIDIQQRVNFIVNRYNQKYRASGVQNLAAIVIEIDSGKVLAYCGNGSFFSDIDARNIDMISAKRSTGSILKPLLYAAMLTEGNILPETMVADIPTKISGYMPENFEKGYDGAVNANEALTRSLNIPFVRLLQNYGVGKFINILQSTGIHSIDKTAEHYGLSLILGGGEASLWEVSGAFASMARSLKHYTSHSSIYSGKSYREPRYIKKDNDKKEIFSYKPTSFLSAAGIYQCFNALTGLQRPEQEGMWQYFSSRQKVAWKTGTSFGNKDAWTIGLTPDYVVGVWVGNASGEPKPNIVGIRLAAPVFFKIINSLPQYGNWFAKPYDEMVKVAVCNVSGYLASADCNLIDSVYIPFLGINSKKCPYHRVFHLDQTGQYRVNSECYKVSKMQRQSFFVLPPTMEYYYKQKNPHYRQVPDLIPECADKSVNLSTEVMEIVYPNNLTSIYIPIDITGDTLSVIFKVKHRNASAKVFWHIDDRYIGKTKDFHEMPLFLTEGSYRLTLTDDQGNSLFRRFNIISER